MLMNNRVWFFDVQNSNSSEHSYDSMTFAKVQDVTQFLGQRNNGLKKLILNTNTYEF